MANLTTITLSASGSVTSSGQFSTIDATFGTAGTSNAVVMTVQGVSGMTAVSTFVNSGTVVIASITGTSNVAITGTGSILVVGTTNVAVVSAVTTATQNVNMVAATTLTVTVSSAVPGTTNVTVVNANANGQATMANSAPVVVASNQSALPVVTNTATAGGASMSVLVSATGLNGTAVKATQGTLYGIQVFNNSATIGYLKFFNATSAPTSSSIAGTTLVPVKTFLIPSATAGAGAIYNIGGVNFSTGITYVLTGGIINTDTTGVAATTMVINVDYA